MNRQVNVRQSARERLAKRLRAERASRNLSQEQLAGLAGMHRTYLGSIERGERNIGIDNIQLLADVLGLDIAALLAPN